MEDNKEKLIHLFNLSYKDTKRSTQTDKWKNYGEDNLIPQHLLDLIYNSPTLGAIINKKSYYTAGEDIIIEDENAKKWAESLDNGNGIYSLVKKMARDLYSFGGITLQVGWKQNQNKIAEIGHFDFSTVRKGVSKLTRDEIKEGKTPEKLCFISLDWKCPSGEYKPITLSQYNGEWNPEFSECYYYQNYRQGGDVIYPRPEWWNSISAVETEINLIKFKKSITENSFVPNGMLLLPGKVPSDVYDEIEKSLKSMSGPDDAGKMMVIGIDGEKRAEFISFNNNPFSRSVNEWLTEARQDIMMSHNLTSPTLLGLPGGASLGGDGGTIVEAKKEFFSNTIKPNQETILHILKQLFARAGYSTEITIKQNFIEITQ